MRPPASGERSRDERERPGADRSTQGRRPRPSCGRSGRSCSTATRRPSAGATSRIGCAIVFRNCGSAASPIAPVASSMPSSTSSSRKQPVVAILGADRRDTAAQGVEGIEHVITVREHDFEYDGRPYKSLSAIARAITNTRWNGWLFFGLNSAAFSQMNTPSRKIRCAIYCRKSQRRGPRPSIQLVACTARKLPELRAEPGPRGLDRPRRQYDDPGFSGGTLERPALQRLIRDIEAEKIDAVVCYRIDRLTRSLT